ncbi:MAG: right-handed parallel beta-helix repeat-containing protein [Anaerolineae bacterium]
MQTRHALTIFALTLGLGLTLILLAGLHTARALTATDRFVKPTGSGSACTQATPCALQTALSQATDGDTIYVAAGVYTGTGAAVITVTKSITLYGGWNGAASGSLVRDPTAYPTILDGERARRVVYLGGGAAPTIADFVIANGWCSGTMNMGGGIYVENGTPIIAGNVITNNFARFYGGGVYVAGGTAVITANEVLSNRVTNGGGGLYFANGAAAWLHGNRIAENTANYGGGLEVDNAVLTATANLVLSNDAASAWIASGGSGWTTAVNNVVVGNKDAFDIRGSHSADLMHNTVALNDGEAVIVQFSAVATLTDNIIAHNDSGVQVSGATASGSYNLFWDNTSTFTGDHAVWADPMLAPDGYHIGFGSGAIDAGVNAGIVTDVDGDRRPIGAGYDIGADERRFEVYLPLVLRNY